MYCVTKHWGSDVPYIVRVQWMVDKSVLLSALFKMNKCMSCKQLSTSQHVSIRAGLKSQGRFFLAGALHQLDGERCDS